MEKKCYLVELDAERLFEGVPDMTGAELEAWVASTAGGLSINRTRRVLQVMDCSTRSRVVAQVALAPAQITGLS